MKRTALVLGLIGVILLLAACGGGNDGTPDAEVGPLAIELLWAEPATGSSPLRVTFTANVTGGLAPYYYAWDYTNDGSVDRYLNGEFRRTLSVAEDYYFRASDPGGVSSYEAVLTVTDSEGTIVTSDPVAINVLGSSGVTLDPAGTGAISDEVVEEEIDGETVLVYVYRTGMPVYFRAQPVGGTPPYEYQWDFDDDGAIDSTVANPQYIFTHTGVGVMIAVVNLEVVDGAGERVMWRTFLEIEGPDSGEEPEPQFDIVVNSTPPADSEGVITVKFDPTEATDTVPAEPEIDLAVIVDPSGGGIPPFEYYWDFENDGALDSQALSPTIPYYDSSRKILINPYFHQESSKTFTLRCMVLDSSGQLQEETRTILAINVANRPPNEMSVETTYGIVNEGGAFLDTPPLPYAEVGDRETTTYAKFSCEISGSTGNTFEFQFDANGDNVPEIPTEGTGWFAIEGSSFDVLQPFQGAGYFPANVQIRALNSDLNVVDTTRIELPISLVIRKDIQLTEGTLDPRTDHCMVATWTTEPHASNGETLTSRELIIVGGARGTTPLNTVQRVLQTYTPPNEEGLIERQVSAVVTERPSINQERRGSVMWANNAGSGAGAEIRIHGGKNEVSGIMASNELSNGGGGNVLWLVLAETLIPEYYPLRDAAGTVVPGLGYVLAGGVNQPAEEANTVVSGKVLLYDSVFDSYGEIANMIKPRYDASVAYVNDRLYIIGGRSPSGQSVATVESYDPNSGQWDTFAPPMIERRSGAACHVVGGQIYVIGGAFWPDNESDRILKTTAEVFNPQTGVWSYTLPLASGDEADDLASTAAPAPGGVATGGAVVNSIVCFGGERPVAGGGSGGEVNNLVEFIYFHIVELPPEV